MRKIPEDMTAGTIHKTNNFGDLEIVKYHNKYSIDVSFVKTGFKLNSQAGNIRSGIVKDCLTPNVFEVGFLSSGKYKAKIKGKQTRQYIRWCGMLERCYSKVKQQSRPTYIGCSVDPLWHNFQNFAKWFDDNYIEGYHLDKDLLHQGNKVYSPDNCIFVPLAINNLILERNAERGMHKIGVCWSERLGKYQSNCHLDGRTIYLGCYNTEEAAHEVYKKYKYAVIKEVAEKQSEPLKSALLSYKIT